MALLARLCIMRLLVWLPGTDDRPQEGFMTRWPGTVRTALAVGIVAAAGAFWAHAAVSGRGQVREITISGDQYAFSPARIEVQKDDLVQIKFSAKDIAHSFTVDVP